MTVTEFNSQPTTEADATGYPDRTPRMILEICRGLTRFPQRPISGPRFFIGSGPGCDLRLGGESFPAIHSLIQTRENGVWFETLAAEPLARLNGELTRGEWLRDGDRIEIGAFQFLAHVLPELPPSAFGTATRSARGPAEHLGELSAAELTERLEGEMGHVERFERGRNAGAQALLQALKQQTRTSDVRHGVAPMFVQNRTRTAASEVSHSVTEAEAEFRVDLDRLCRDLEELTKVLERRSETISHRELQFAQVAESMVDAQRELVSQLESALETAANLRDSHSEPMKPTIRVSA
ncbi:MAG: hypothetical protein JWM11_7727 [Planctomycetaceae bacterium]|nr:hypothetical protein [Planctomycetaceae bacterium]